MSVITDFKFKLDRDMVLKFIGCSTDSEVYDEVCETYDILTKKIKGLLEPKAVFKFVERPKDYIMDDVKDCNYIVYCLLTIGEKVTKHADEYFSSSQYLEGMLMDALSDYILGEYSSQLYDMICKEARERGLGLSCKLSPGNADFHIGNQKRILQELKGDELLNITVTEGFMLRPVKSVSFIFGADASLDIPLSDHECSRCTSTTCKMRKEPFIDKNSDDSTLKLTVLLSEKKFSVQAPKKKSILDILIDNKIKIPSPCAGNGTCGKCRIKIIEGKVKRLASNSKLGETMLKEGWCLACSSLLQEDTIIQVSGNEKEFSILDTFEDSDTDIKPIYKVIPLNIRKVDLKGRGLAEAINLSLNSSYKFSLKAIRTLGTELNSPNLEIKLNLIECDNTIIDICRKRDINVYGIAVDIGTTTLAVSLINLLNGKIMRTYSLLNSQRQFGADVISRIQRSNEGKLDSLKGCIKNDIMKAIKELCRLEGIDANNIYHIAIAGNTTMLYFFLGLHCESLAVFPFNTITTSLMEYKFREVFDDDFLDCRITLLPGVSAYVGADIISGLLMCNFHETEKTTLLIDIGTNGEMIIGNRDKMLCLATAAGPAFEGANINCGIGSVKGAICSVEIRDGGVTYKTIGDAEPIGICGSAVIDIVATCLNNSIIDDTGRFDEEAHEEGFIKIAELAKEEVITFNQKDVREVQLAKSAIRSGIEILLKNFNCSYNDVDKVLIAGGFGSHVNIKNAISIGLIPREFETKVKIIGNSSLGGAIKYLLNSDSRNILDLLLQKISYIDISADENFNDLFIENMLF